MFQVTNTGIHQGIYIVTPSGRMLSRANSGWPDPDPAETLRKMKEATSAYYRLPKQERLLQTQPDPAKDGLRFESDSFKPPAGTLELRVTKRGYAYPGMTTFDERHPKFFGIDKLWFKPSEWRRFIPQSLTVGATAQVTGAPMERWVLHNHMQKACSAWDRSHIKSGSMTATVEKREGTKVTIALQASYTLKADTQWNKGAYQGNLLGRLVYDSARDTVASFESVMFGTQDMGTFLPNARAGELVQKVATYATINPKSDPDDMLLPSDWKWGYTLRWCQTP